MNAIKKEKENREKLMAQIEQAEQNGESTTRSHVEGAEGYDPVLAREIAQKKQYVEKLRQKLSQYAEQS